MEQLQPRHHPARIVAYEVGVDSVGVEHCLGDLRLSLAAKRSNDCVELAWFVRHLQFIGLSAIPCRVPKSASMTRQLHLSR